jgi:ABC-type dipeptide/oligopeptide/nickel transport system permease subunit
VGRTDCADGHRFLRPALPFLILALAVLAFFGNSAAAVHRAARLPCLGALRPHRARPGDQRAANEQGYAAAVRQLGAGPARIYGRHILPNIASTLIVSMTLTFPEIILLESGLSFLGLGVQPPATSLGNMVGYGRDYLSACAVDPADPGRHDRDDDAVDQPFRRLAARPAGPDIAVIFFPCG